MKPAIKRTIHKSTEKYQKEKEREKEKGNLIISKFYSKNSIYILVGQIRIVSRIKK